MSTATSDPMAFPTAEIHARTTVPRWPTVMEVRLTPDIATRLLTMIAGGAGIDQAELVSDAAREGVRKAFDDWTATLSPEKRERAIQAAQQGDDDLAQSIAVRLRMLEDERRNAEFRRRVEAEQAERNRPTPKTPEQLLAEAAAPWLEATAGTGWLGNFVSWHRTAVVNAMGGEPLKWPYQPLREDEPFMSAVRRILGVDADATLDPGQLEQVRAAVRVVTGEVAKAVANAPRNVTPVGPFRTANPQPSFRGA